MKSIQKKILTLVVGCVLFSTITVMVIGLMNAQDTLEKDSLQMMNLLCEKHARQIDTTLENVKQSVDTIYHFAMEDIVSGEKIWEKENEMDDYIRNVKELAETVADNTQGAVAVYYRFNHDVTKLISEIYMKQTNDSFIDYNVDDMADSDMAKEPWYAQPVENKDACWIAPYENKIIKKEVISYCVPVIVEDIVIGVIGMDIDIQLLRDNLSKVQIYDTGYAFLMDSKGNMVYHVNSPLGVELKASDKKVASLQEKLSKAAKKNEAYSYQWGSEKKRLVVRECMNDMYVAISVSESEVEKPKQQLLVRSLITLLVAICIAVVFATRLSKMIVKPLKELTKAAGRIAQGDLDVVIECKSNDEVGELSKSFGKTAKTLKKNIQHISRLAYTDALTQTMNKTAYGQMVSQLEQDIQNDKGSFAVVVMDINNLKKVNDNFGHEMGDAMIGDASRIMKEVFSDQYLYRIGGDEFVCILIEEQLIIANELVGKFSREIDAFNASGTRTYQVPLQVAVGLAMYDENTDNEYAQVFRRSDTLMYENKKSQKEAGKK